MKKVNYFLIVLIASASLLSNYKKYTMTVEEINIFNSVASSSYEFEESYIDKISKSYPNLSSSAIPIKGVLGGFYITHDSIPKGIELLKEAVQDNPYIGYPDMLLGRIYELIGQQDSFNLYTTRAYNKLPSNSASYLLKAKKLINEKEFDSLNYFFNQMSSRVNDTNIWQIYLAAMFSVDGRYEELKIDSTLVVSNAKKAKILVDDDITKLLSNYIIYGKDKVLRNLEKYEIAQDTFETNPDYAISLLREVLLEIDDNFEYYETIVEMYFFQKNYRMVTSVYSEMRNKEMTTIKGNVLEMIAISFLYNDNIVDGCNLIKLLINSDYYIDTSLIEACQSTNI